MLSRCVRQDARAPCLAAANSVETPRTPCTPRGSCHLQRPLRKLGYLAARHAWQAPAWMQLLHHSAPAACALARRVSRSFLLPPGMDGALTMRPVILKMVPVAPFVDLSCSTHDDDALICAWECGQNDGTRNQLVLSASRNRCREDIWRMRDGVTVAGGRKRTWRTRVGERVHGGDSRDAICMPWWITFGRCDQGARIPRGCRRTRVNAPASLYPWDHDGTLRTCGQPLAGQPPPVGPAASSALSARHIPPPTTHRELVDLGDADALRVGGVEGLRLALAARHALDLHATAALCTSRGQAQHT